MNEWNVTKITNEEFKFFVDVDILKLEFLSNKEKFPPTIFYLPETASKRAANEANVYSKVIESPSAKIT
jgi:hypothetical protein